MSFISAVAAVIGTVAVLIAAIHSSLLALLVAGLAGFVMIFSNVTAKLIPPRTPPNSELLKMVRQSDSPAEHFEDDEERPW